MTDHVRHPSPAAAHPPPAAEQPIRVLCVDDHPGVQEGVADMIGREADMEVVARAGDGWAAVDAYDRLRPDVTLMDLRLPRMSGVDAIRAIRRRNAEARIIALTLFDSDEALGQALEAGASAYVLKDALVDSLVTAVRNVCGLPA